MAIYAITAIPFSFYGLVAVMYCIYDTLDDFLTDDMVGRLNILHSNHFILKDYG